MAAIKFPYFKVVYHVFTDHCDEWTADYNEAERLFHQFAADKGCARLYEERYPTRNNQYDEDCLLAVGDYPA
ncbi:hypothetical protein QWJ26_26530 [Streptomyces sp. CSDS2]|uniref:hypothetical protein n=1 Tax=Streptomyces sp. CSDS2 TaxID=3055051 RepID=UPI0025B07190|nr:hypothetical protein [Streptomyces sp. CSDS2]MDN3263302.1 hypothetical protein [Streptomyces sp. CSDS2]